MPKNQAANQAANPATLTPADVVPRVGAALVDIVIITAVSYILCIPFFKILKLDATMETIQQQATLLERDPLAVDPEFVQSLLPVMFGLSVLLLVLLLLMHAYYIYFESTTGQTPGKKLLGLRVVNLEGGAITQKQAVYREMIRWYFDGLFIFPAFIAMYSNARRQRVGDILAKTMVIKMPAGRRT